MSMTIHAALGLVDDAALREYEAIKAVLQSGNSLNTPYLLLEDFSKSYRHKAGGKAMIESLRIEYTALVCKILKI